MKTTSRAILCAGACAAVATACSQIESTDDDVSTGRIALTASVAADTPEKPAVCYTAQVTVYAPVAGSAVGDPAPTIEKFGKPLVVGAKAGDAGIVQAILGCRGGKPVYVEMKLLAIPDDCAGHPYAVVGMWQQPRVAEGRCVPFKDGSSEAVRIDMTFPVAKRGDGVEGFTGTVSVPSVDLSWKALDCEKSIMPGGPPVPAAVEGMTLDAGANAPAMMAFHAVRLPPSDAGAPRSWSWNPSNKGAGIYVHTGLTELVPGTTLTSTMAFVPKPDGELYAKTTLLPDQLVLESSTGVDCGQPKTDLTQQWIGYTSDADDAGVGLMFAARLISPSELTVTTVDHFTPDEINFGSTRQTLPLGGSVNAVRNCSEDAVGAGHRFALGIEVFDPVDGLSWVLATFDDGSWTPTPGSAALRYCDQPTAILLPFLTSGYGFDTGVSIVNDSSMTGPGPANGVTGSVDLYFYSGGKLVAQRTKPSLAPGERIDLTLSGGGLGIDAVPNFNGYAIVAARFPSAHAMSMTTLLGQPVGPAVQGVAIPVHARPSNLADTSPSRVGTTILLPFLTNQAGFDTGIAIANSNLDPFGTRGDGGSCSLILYGGSSTPTSNLLVKMGEVGTTTVSMVAPGFQGYGFVRCPFANAQAYVFLSDLGARNLYGAYVGTILPPGNRPAPLGDVKSRVLFPFASNQTGFDTGLSIANTSLDPLGTTAQAGTCTLHFLGQTGYGGPPPAPQTTQTIAAGGMASMTVSSGGTHGLQGAPGFQGAILAECTFPHAAGSGIVSTMGMPFGAAYLEPTDVSLGYPSSGRALAFPLTTNTSGLDTGIAFMNVLDSPCTTDTPNLKLRFLRDPSGNAPAPIMRCVEPGKMAMFTLSGGGSNNIPGNPGFHGSMFAEVPLGMVSWYMYSTMSWPMKFSGLVPIGVGSLHPLP